MLHFRPASSARTVDVPAVLQVDDMCSFAEDARQRHAAATTNSSSSNASAPANTVPAVPWLLGGYSIGGLTAAHTALRQQGQWLGLVLVSAASGLHTHGLLTR
jgi:predicted esterase